MDIQKAKDLITEYWKEVSNFNDKFSVKLDEAFSKYAVPEVAEKIKSSQGMPEFEITSAEKVEDDIIEVKTKGMVYSLTEINGELKIFDVSQVCVCVLEDVPGKCPVCHGHGHLHTEDGEQVECPECGGDGICPICGGSELMSVADITEEIVDAEELDNMKKLEIEDKESFMNFLHDAEFEDDIPEALLEIISDMRFELDNIQQEVFLGVEKTYRKYFDTDNFEYTNFMFPVFETVEIAQIMEIPEEGFFCEFITANEELGLKFVKQNDGEFKIEAIDLPCPILDENPELHEDPIQCLCVEENDGNPDPDCETCYGTGIIVCPMCFGEGWVPYAPEELNLDDENLGDYYREGVKLVYPELFEDEE